MDCSYNCFGAAAAAKVPVKRYNLLVPDLFPLVEPDFHKPTNPSIERKLKKLSEYLERNEHRAPKVSRRLARRLYKDLRSNRFGFVKLAVYAYLYLLQASKADLCQLFATEIVVKSAKKQRRDWLCNKNSLGETRHGSLGSVVGVLLLHAAVEMRLLGVELLTEFIRLQNSSDYVAQLEGFVPLLCETANPKLPYRGVGNMKAPNAADLSTLQAACLRCLLEHLRYCSRLAYVSHHLDDITYCVLENIDSASSTPGQSLLEVAGEARSALQNGSHSATVLSKTSVGVTVGISTPQVAALLVFQEVSHLTKDAAEGKKVLESLMRYLDGGKRWLGGPVLEAGMGVLRQACAEEHQRYLLYSSLLRHVPTPGLSVVQRVAVLEQALQDGLLLDQALAAPALLLALRELPPIMNQGVGILSSPGMASTPPAESPSRVGYGSAPVPDNGGGGQAGGGVMLEAGGVGRSLSDSEGGRVSSLRGAVLSCIRQLSRRVGESSALLEVVASIVNRLVGPQGSSTAVLECCAAAAGVVPGLPEEDRVLAGHSFPQLLLQELMVIAVMWGVHQRLLALRLLLLLLPVAGDGLKEGQAKALLACIWHQALLAGNPPAIFAALDSCFAALIAASPTTTLAYAVRLAATLQAEVAEPPSSSKLDGVPAAACCALLCLCKSMLQQLASTLGHQQLVGCAVEGCSEALTSLTLTPSGLQLAPRPPAALDAERSAPPAGFSAAEQQAAEQFLLVWRAGTAGQAELDKVTAAWQGVPLLRANGNRSLESRFQPLPVASLAPRMKATGVMSSGASSQGGSTSGGESKWVKRVRHLYRNMSTAVDATQDLQDLMQDTGLPRPDDGTGPAIFNQQYKEAICALQLKGQSAEEVLADIDSALASMEMQVEQGRSPAHAGLLEC